MTIEELKEKLELIQKKRCETQTLELKSAEDIQKKINEQCLQIEPVVRPLLTVVENIRKVHRATLLFSPYPQAYFPQLCITAIVVPGKELGELGEAGERFLDNQRIEDNIPDKPKSSKQLYYSE